MASQITVIGPKDSLNGRNDDMKSQLVTLRNASEEVTTKTKRIYETVLRDSENIKQGNFAQLGVGDLEALFDLYDNLFFSDLLRKQLREKNGGTLRFRLSKRMTRAGGKTTCIRKKLQKGDGPKEATYEIAISTALLFQTFKDVKRAVSINGLVCRDRLEALQRIFEHELIHLAEMLAWGKSSCSRPNFQLLARQIFGHKDITHQLVTQHERALVNFNIKVGDTVAFEYNGKRLTGFVNRITKRATILVENKKGDLYANGKRYSKYYVPLSGLEKQ
ncbi:MAG: SprT-like family protein [Candidatus Thorarchaeota archaeon]